MCFEMLLMSFAAAEAYNYESYVVNSVRNYGSFFYIIKDIIKIFRIELRLFKPRALGFKEK